MQLTNQEAEELYQYMLNSYLDPNRWPALLKLLAKIDTHLNISERNMQKLSAPKQQGGDVHG